MMPPMHYLVYMARLDILQFHFLPPRLSCTCSWLGYVRSHHYTALNSPPHLQSIDSDLFPDFALGLLCMEPARS
jgi:hypothetical protein